MEVRTAAFRARPLEGSSSVTSEQRQRLDSTAREAADQITRRLDKALRDHVHKERKIWEPKSNDVLTGYCCPTHVEQLKFHHKESIATFNNDLREYHSITQCRIGLQTGLSQVAHIHDSRPSAAASAMRQRPRESAYPCEYQLMTAHDPRPCSLVSLFSDPWSQIPFAEEVQNGSLVLSIHTVGSEIHSCEWDNRSDSQEVRPETAAQLDRLAPFSKAYMDTLKSRRSGRLGRSRPIQSSVKELKTGGASGINSLFGKLVVEVSELAKKPATKW